MGEDYLPIRKSTEISLKKLFMTILKGEYPEIKGIVISSTDLGVVITYRVGIGLLYDDLPANDDDRLRNRVKELSKYVLDKNGTLENVYYYDPNY
jgi:hypothetical protein